MSVPLDKFMKLPTSELGAWEERYRNLKPNVRNVLDKIMRSEKFKKQAKAAGGADKELDTFWHWSTSVFNAHEYIGGISGEEPAVISKAEVSTVAEIFSKPWRAFEHSWWEKHIRETVLPEYTKMVPTRIDDPDKMLEDIKAGRYIYGYFPEDVESWLKGKEHYAPSLYTGEHWISFIRGDINDGTAVCGFATNGDYYYVRTYTKGAAVMKLVREMPEELKPYVEKDEFGGHRFRVPAMKPPETVEEHAEKWSREFEEAKAKAEEKEFIELAVREARGEGGTPLSGPTESHPYFVKISPSEMMAFITIPGALRYIKEHGGKGEVQVHKDLREDFKRKFLEGVADIRRGVTPEIIAGKRCEACGTLLTKPYRVYEDYWFCRECAKKLDQGIYPGGPVYPLMWAEKFGKKPTKEIAEALARRKPQIKELELGDYLTWGGARIMVFDGMTNGEVRLDDPFEAKGEYAWTTTPEEFESNVDIPTKEYVISEYERLGRPKPKDFERRLSKLPTRGPTEQEEAEFKRISRMPTEARDSLKEALEEREVPKLGRVEFPIKLIISKGYDIEQYPKGITITEETIPISITHRPNIGEVEDYVNQGREELDLYEALRQVGGESVYILMSLQQWGMASYPQLASVFKKVEEDKWGEITDEEESQLTKAFDEALAKEWVLTWAPADVEWKPEVLKDREIYHSKYSYDTLMARTADEVKNIARVKGVSLAGRKDEIARRVHEFDFGKEEAEAKLKEIDKLLG